MAGSLIRRGRPDRGNSFKAASQPKRRYFCTHSRTVLRFTPWARAIAPSLLPAAASKRIAARTVRRFSSVRERRITSSCWRSAALSITALRFLRNGISSRKHALALLHSYLSNAHLASEDSIRSAVRSVRPNVIVNAAAYTAVDRAESESELSLQVNGIAPGILAEEANRCRALLVHYSTDYVFDGSKRTPYVEEDETASLNCYGRTKLTGEQ